MNVTGTGESGKTAEEVVAEEIWRLGDEVARFLVVWGRALSGEERAAVLDASLLIQVLGGRVRRGEVKRPR